MKFVKITLLQDDKPQSSYIESFEGIDPGYIEAMIEGLEDGDSYKLEGIEMTQDEYENLPEFTGF